MNIVKGAFGWIKIWIGPDRLQFAFVITPTFDDLCAVEMGSIRIFKRGD